MTAKTHRFTTCHRHPTKPITGFCASCLRERLAGIPPSPSTPASPDLRRTKSSSGRNHPDAPSSSATEPRRHSCEIRLALPRGPLSDLFTVNDDLKNNTESPNWSLAIHSQPSGVEIRENKRGDAVRISDDDDEEEKKTMKEFIDLELRRRKNEGRDFRDIAVSFRDVFSKRLMKWKRKQKLKRNPNVDDGGGDVSVVADIAAVSSNTVEVEKLGLTTTRETQSEVGEYGFTLGRRSCDTDLRFSLDDSQFSFEAPRASWDGYLIGKSCPRVFSPMVRVGDDRVLFEEDEEEGEEEEEEVNLGSCQEHYPGGSTQTKHYYSDWNRRRKSFDRSNSRRKPVIGDVNELRVMSNAKVSPATTELFYGAKLLITENDLRDANLKPLSSVQSGYAMGSDSNHDGDDDACDVAIRVDQKGLNKFHKLGRLWNKLGLVQRRKEGCVVGEDMVNKPIAESWQKLRRAGANETVSQRLIRSYSVSCGETCRIDGLGNGVGGGAETKGNVLNGRQKVLLQRNRSVRYSPNNVVDNGLLRFYLTPLKSHRRSRSGKSSLKDLNPTARGFL
ncbi:hypothetical protein RJT34_12683 [Clitoria ternatea]|uniref:Uncharacterized protein n=1 Tax=Clitoria ternatea TaxID=43366 RepID=A0AAN9JQ99_CLITE